MSSNKTQYQTCYKPESHGIKIGHRPGSDRAVECLMFEHHMERKMAAKVAEIFPESKNPWPDPPASTPQDHIYDTARGSIINYDTEKEQVLILTRGLPASGKTTWAKQWLKADPKNRMRINRDSLRETTYGAYVLENHQEYAITKIQKTLLKQYLFGKEPKSVIIDDTFLNASNLKNILDFVEESHIQHIAEGHNGRNIKVLVKDFPLTAEEALTRNADRVNKGERSVPPKVIIDMVKRAQVNKKGEIQPLSQEMTQQITHMSTSKKPEQYQHNEKIQDGCYLVDIDGTLALIDKTQKNPRSPYDLHRVIEDLPNAPVIDMVKALRSTGNKIVIMSGREDSCKVDTETWLKNNGIMYEDIFMRKTGDQRKDSIVKWEMYLNNVKNKYNVHACIDDRNQVVEMYRSRGFKVFQVAPGDF